MRLTSYSDYSLRLLMYAALKGDGPVTIQEVSDAYGISRNHLMKVALDLGRNGFLETVRGRNGGMRLARKPGEIGLGAVLRTTEEDFNTVECFNTRSNTCIIAVQCRLKGALARALKAYFEVLAEYTLADLTGKHPALARLLVPA